MSVEFPEFKTKRSKELYDTNKRLSSELWRLIDLYDQAVKGHLCKLVGVDLAEQKKAIKRQLGMVMNQTAIMLDTLADMEE